MTPNEMHIVRMTVTPAMANEWISQNNTNYRFPNEKTIDGLARAMSAGEWKLTPQGISLDPDGLVIDGQHRLMAIIKSGVSVQMFVAFNVPKETELVIDSNKPRRFRDHARYIGTGFKEQDLALAKIMNNPRSLTYSPFRYQPFEQIELVNRYAEGIAFVLQWKARYIKSPALAPVAMAFYYPEHRGELTAFMDLFYSGKSSNPKDSAAIALRDVVLLKREKNDGALFAKAQTALIAFLKRKPLSKLYAGGFDLDAGSLSEIYFSIKMDTNGKIVPDRKGGKE
jgi:hypothetical protein